MHKPDLKSTEFALMIADGLTGRVFNTDFELYTDDKPKSVYFVFDDLQALKRFVEKLNDSNDTYEYYIHNYNYEVIEFIKAKKWS